MSHSFYLTPDERAQLEAARHDDHPAVRRRVQALLLLADGHTFAEVTQRVEMKSRRSLYNWIRLWSENGVAGLAGKSKGRPQRANRAYYALLEVVLAAQPETFGLNAPGWTVELLNRLMETKTGVSLGENTFRRLLHTLGYSFEPVPRPPLPEAIRKPPSTMKELKRWGEAVIALPITGKDTYSWQKRSEG